MRIGMVGLGRMGMNMSRRLLRAGHGVVGYNRSPEKARELVTHGGQEAATLADLASALGRPRVVWVMLPAGEAVDQAIAGVMPHLDRGDIVVDGGNTHYRDDMRRAHALGERGIGYVDVGVSGGIWGLREGFCLMAGGEKKHYRKLLPALKALAPPKGYMHCGPTGAGHFVKMIHNGIEYGLMAAYAEGFDLMRASEFGPDLDLAKVSALWMRGSVVRSWLLELLGDALARDPGLADIEGYVEDSGEGRWTIEQAVATAVPTPVITASVYQRFRSRRGGDSFADRVLAALRREFGGHAVVERKGKGNNR